MKIKKGLKIRTIADENILILQGALGVDMTKVVAFNETARWLWNELIEKEFSLEDVTHLLVTHFNVDMVIAEKDARNWVDRLSACNALEI